MIAIALFYLQSDFEMLFAQRNKVTIENFGVYKQYSCSIIDCKYHDENLNNTIDNVNNTCDSYISEITKSVYDYYDKQYDTLSVCNQNKTICEFKCYIHYFGMFIFLANNQTLFYTKEVNNYEIDVFFAYHNSIYRSRKETEIYISKNGKISLNTDVEPRMVGFLTSYCIYSLVFVFLDMYVYKISRLGYNSFCIIECYILIFRIIISIIVLIFIGICNMSFAGKMSILLINSISLFFILGLMYYLIRDHISLYKKTLK